MTASMSRGASKPNAVGRKRLSEGLVKLGFHPVPSEAELCIIVVGPDANTFAMNFCS